MWQEPDGSRQALVDPTTTHQPADPSRIRDSAGPKLITPPGKSLVRYPIFVAHIQQVNPRGSSSIHPLVEIPGERAVKFPPWSKQSFVPIAAAKPIRLRHAGLPNDHPQSHINTQMTLYSDMQAVKPPRLVQENANAANERRAAWQAFLGGADRFPSQQPRAEIKAGSFHPACPIGPFPAAPILYLPVLLSGSILPHCV